MKPTTGTFTKTPNWLDWYDPISQPRFQLPAGSVDAHCHVFGPGEIYPYAPERKYTPCDASHNQLFALRDQLGFERNVIVQATCHGSDNRAMVAACQASQGRARGVATVKRDITEAALWNLHEAGVRGVRFNFVKRLVDFTPKDELLEIAHKIKPLGWHVVVYFEAPDLLELEPFFEDIPTPLVVDHMGRPDVSLGADSVEFERFLRWMSRKPNRWCKVTCPERLSQTGPRALSHEIALNAIPYLDVIPFAHKVCQLFPDRVLWGTDWPHPNLKEHMPDDALLLNVIPAICPEIDAQQRLLIHNPIQLYWN